MENMGKQEIIKLIIKLLWITKGGNDFSVTFNGKFATLLDQDNSTSVALDMTINDESYRNIVNALNSAPNFFIEKHGENFNKRSSASSNSQLNTLSLGMGNDSTNKKSNLLDDSDISASVAKSLTHEESNDQLSNDIEKYQENEIQSSDSIVLPLNHEESTVRSSNAIERDQGNETQDLDLNIAGMMIQEDDSNDLVFVAHLNHEESDGQLPNQSSSSVEMNQENEIQVLDSNVQESLQYDNPQSDEYADSTEEVDEQRFDTLTSRFSKRNSRKPYQSKINEKFKVSKTIKKNKPKLSKTKIRQVNKVSNELVNDSIERVPSDLTEDDSLPSVNEILKPSITRSNHSSKETNISHPDAETSVVESNRNPSTLSSNINEQNPSDNRQYPIVLIPSIDTKNSSSANPDATKKSKKRKRTSKLSSNKGKKKIQCPLYESDSDDTVNKIETNEALLLKNNFRNLRNSQLIVYGDRLFSKNRSIEDLLTTKFSHIFNDNDEINFSFSLPSYSTNNIESLENYFKVWSLQYNQLNLTKTQMKEKMLKLLYELGEHTYHYS
ncbi:17133_t:CDS:10, partial [Cetraspora pellucida]